MPDLVERAPGEIPPRLACLALVVVALCGCYRSHTRVTVDAAVSDGPRSLDASPDARLEDAGVPPDAPFDDAGRPECEAPTTAPTCAGVAAIRPSLYYPLDGDVENRGDTPGYAGALSGARSVVRGAFGSALSFAPGESAAFPGTRDVLGAARTLVFSFWTRSDGLGRAALSCRSWTEGFETYRTSAGWTTCAGDGYGPPRAWGACSTVDECGEGEWTHFVLRWRGVGTEAEVTSDGVEWRALTASMGYPIAHYDLFAYADDLAMGLAVGDGALASGTLEVDDVRVYDALDPDGDVWAVTSCPVP